MIDDDLDFWISKHGTIYIIKCKCGQKFNCYQQYIISDWVCPACSRSFQKEIKIREIYNKLGD